MAVKIPETREEQDDAYNPGNLHAAEQFNGYTSAGIDQVEAFVNDPKNASKKTQDAEENPNEINYTGKGVDKPRSQGNIFERTGAYISNNKKKSGAVLGLIGGGGILGLLFGVLGPFSMLVSLTENLVDTNNGAESAFDRRISKVLGVKLTDESGVCNAKQVKCKMGRISTKGLKKIENKGFIALDEDGNKLSESSGKYPDKKIAQYQIEGFDDPVPADRMKQHLADNPSSAAKLLGRAGAFNVRFEVWRGQYLKKNFYDRWSIKRNGGLADGENKRNGTVAEIAEKLKSKLPKTEGLAEKAQAKVNAKAEKLIKRGKKGGVVYLSAVGSCMGVKAPSMIASGVAAVQLARVLPLSSDVIMSPGSKNKASMLSNITAEDIEAPAKLLTTTDQDGKSALDSEILQSAIGVNKNKTGVSKEFSPGYSLLTSSVMRQSKNVSSATEDECNAVLSPQAMYTAAAVNSAVTVAASTTIIGGIVKVAAEWAASEAIGYVAGQAFDKYGKEIIGKLAENDELDKALAGRPGKKLGDAVGVSALAFFSTGAAARNVPVLKQSQLVAYNAIQKEQAEQQRKTDLASLSPFDTSSKYTFFGSILNNMNMAVIARGSASSYTSSTLSYLASSPLRLLSPSTYAASLNNSTNYCSYAKDFDMEAGDITPAVNAAGLPCYGYVGNLSTEDAIAVATGENQSNEKWIKDEVDEDADLTEIVESDTRLAEYIDGCGATSIESGEWTDAAAGCTIDTNSNPALNAGSGKAPVCTEVLKENCFNNTEGIGETKFKSSDAKESEAVAAIAIDYQVSQMIDGNDEEQVASTSQPNATGATVTVATYNVWGYSHNPSTYKERLDRGVRILRKNNIGVAGLQEFQKQQFDYLQESADEYSIYPDRWTGNGKKSENSIIWKTDDFTVLDKGTVPGLKYFNGGSLDAPWMKLQHNTSKQIFYFLNTHDPSNPDGVDHSKERLDNAIAQRKFIESLGGTPAVLTGDFNSGYCVGCAGGNTPYQNKAENLTYCIHTKDNFMSEAYDVDKNRPAKCPNPPDNGDWDKKIYNGGVDHIFFTSNLKGSGYSISSPYRAGSDHPLISIGLSFPGADGSAGPVSKDGWVWPIAADESKPGPCYGGGSVHAGLDINSDGDGKIYAMHDGVVVNIIDGKTGSSPATGNHIMIKTSGGIYYGYQHLSPGRMAVGINDPVKAGQVIGYGGKTGNVQASSKIHLHITMARTNTTGSYGNLGSTFDPLTVLQDVKPSTYNCTGRG